MSRISDLRQFVFMKSIPILVICEPNISKPIRISGYELFLSATLGEPSKVAVFIRRELSYVHHFVQPYRGNEYVCLTIRKRQLTFTLVGVYLHPTSRFQRKRLDDILSTTTGPWVITGDFNAHHMLWGSPNTNRRGRSLVAFASDHGLCLLNDGSPTYLRGTNYGSCLDLTFVSRCLSARAQWFPDIETRGSDHIPTYLKINGLRSSFDPNVIRVTDWSKFQSRMDEICRSDELENLESVIESTLQACKRSVRLSPKVTEFDVELERLRAVRRRAERRYRRAKCLEDL